MKTEVAEMNKWRTEKPAHFIHGLKTLSDAQLTAFMRAHNIRVEKENPQGRIAKTARVDAILAWNMEQDGAEQRTESKSKHKKRAPKSDSESEADSESDSEIEESSSESDVESSDSDSDTNIESEVEVSSDSESEESEPPTPPVKQKKVKPPPAPNMPPKKIAKPTKQKSPVRPKRKEKNKPSKQQKVVVVVKTEKRKSTRKSKTLSPKPASPKAEVDQDGDVGTEVKYVESADQPDAKDELAILLGELRTGNASILVRRKLKDTQLRERLTHYVDKQVKGGSLPLTEARNIKDDYGLN